MSSKVFVRRGRNNLRDERKGSWQMPVSVTHSLEGDDPEMVAEGAKLPDDGARPFRFSLDSLHSNTDIDNLAIKTAEIDTRSASKAKIQAKAADDVKVVSNKTPNKSSNKTIKNISNKDIRPEVDEAFQATANVDAKIAADKASNSILKTFSNSSLNKNSDSILNRVSDTATPKTTVSKMDFAVAADKENVTKINSDNSSNKVTQGDRISTEHNRTSTEHNRTSTEHNRTSTEHNRISVEHNKTSENNNASEDSNALEKVTKKPDVELTNAHSPEEKSSEILDNINLDELEVENASGQWVEYHSLFERISSIDFRDKSFLIKACVAVVLIITIFFFSLQCIILKSEYDRINDKLVSLQNEFVQYKDSLEAQGDVTENDITLSNAAEAVSIVSKQGQGSDQSTRYVYLTFDDGPSSQTSAILDILSEYDVKATFFVCGKDGYDDMYKRIVDEGHTIGMHSYSHEYTSLYESLDSFQTDLHKIQNYIFDITGVWTTYYRFPGGSSNTISQVSMSDLIGYLDRNNITYFDWNVYGGDNIASDIIVTNVTANITEHENCIILLHDASDKKETVEALPEIIEYVQSLPDTVIVPITDDTVPVQHSKNQ